MNAKIAGLVAAMAILAVAGVAGFQAVRASSGSSTSVKAEAQLSFPSDPLTSGRAKSEQLTGATSRTRFAIEIEDVSRQPGAYPVRITRSLVELQFSPVTLDINSLGEGELEMDTLEGAANVPVAVAGDLVEVLDPADGVTVIASGELIPK